MSNVDHFPDGISGIIKHCKSMESDHTPNSHRPRPWTTTALCDEVARLKSLNKAYVQTLSNVTTIYQQMLEALEEVDECAAYWSEYDVPLGLRDRIKAAIAKARDEQ